MQEISSALGATIQLDELLVLIMEKITKLMDAERSSLFLLDEETGELWSKVSQGIVDQEIRLQPGEGIAGWVAQRGKSLNVRDAYRDPRFNPDTDAETGFTTDSILCQPVRNQEGKTIGVVEVLNAESGEFTPTDENLLSSIASQAAIAIENSKLYQSALKTNHELREIKRQLEKKVAELDLLYEVERELGQAVDFDELVESITQKILDLVDAEASALTLKQPDHYQSYVLVDRLTGIPERDWDFSEMQYGQEGGISARAMQTGEPVICGTGDCVPVPDETSETMGVPVENAVAVPLFDDDECIGSLKVANRRHDEQSGEGAGGFTDDDVKILTLIAGQIAGAVAAQRNREEREKKERLAAIGQALSGVLHDLKNPASIISGYVQLMVKADEREKRERYAKSVEQQFDQFDQMTRELLVFARGETNVVLEEVEVCDFMDDLRELLGEEMAAKDTELEVDVDCSGTIQIDSAKIKRAILNLARNAAEAMDDEGTVRVRVGRSETGDLLFEVEDNGEGIPEEIRETLYDSFVTQGKTHGTGLGLAIVQKVVEDLDGELDFETEIGEGTTFSMRIPQTR
jgi:signal transduction histidine kinase/putative methionine-R-sulfoxide reductase with GAF domain